jgi:DNA processing protein
MQKVTLRELLGRDLNYVEQKYAPTELYVEGSLKLPLKAPRVSVIGTRNPSPIGKDVARLIVEKLVKNGIIVVSGLARGIDTIAHTTAIELDGKTIAVLGTPLNKFYPPENKDLQLKIMKEHLAITQFSPNHVTIPSDFLKRDRTIALISNATIIVEAKQSGGTVFTGWEAIRLGRPLFIWKDTYDNHNLLWIQEMKKNGAKRLNEETIDELLTTLSSKTE